MTEAVLTTDADLPAPFIYVEGVANFRDLGGHPVTSTHSIRQSFIYRCGDLSRVSSPGVNTLQELGIKNAYDLRSYSEIEKGQKEGKGGFAEWDGCERVFVPVRIHF